MRTSPAPEMLWIVRHGESAGNVARDAAEAAGLPVIAIATRDQDVPLSELGREQARALGHCLAELAAAERPTAVLVSPYVRAQETARIALDTAGIDVDLHLDERVREREFGVLDRLTRGRHHRAVSRPGGGEGPGRQVLSPATRR